jgi:chitodextrinase
LNTDTCGNSPALTRAGQSYILFGGPFFLPSTPNVINLSNANVTINGVGGASGAGASDLAGRVSSDGDVNEDGKADLLIGAPGANQNAGAAYLLLGRANWSPTINLVPQNVFTFNGVVSGFPGDQLGGAVSLSGDLNRDGKADLLIGASGASPVGRTNAGTVYLFYGKTSWPTGQQINLLSTPADVTIRGANAGDRFGITLESRGDVNGDQVPDLIMAAIRASPNGLPQAGTNYLLFGRDQTNPTTQPLASIMDMATVPDVVLNGQGAGDSAGFSVALGGDLNGDSVPDILVGADTANTSNGTNSGRFFYYKGSAALDTTAPTVPTGLFVFGVSPTSTVLNWNPATDNVGVTDYKIYRDGFLVAPSTNGLVSYTDFNLAPGTTYTYTVKAVDAGGNTSFDSSAVNAGTSLDTSPPSVPTGLSAAAAGATQINLTWQPSSDNVGVTGYTIFRNTVQIATVSTNSFPDTNLVPNTLYTYRVSAFDGSGNNSAQSASASATTTTDTTAPSIPTGLSAIPAGPSEIYLTWQASTDNVGVAGYRIYRDGTLLPTPTSTTNYTDTGLTACTHYTYTVAAYDGEGNTSGQSAPVLTAADATPPSTPTGLIANAVSPTEIDLAWNASTDNCGEAPSYRIFRNGTPIATVTGFVTFSDTTLAPNTTYTYSVRAVDAGGNLSASSLSANATTSPDTIPPSVPTGLSAQAVSASQINLTWQPSSDNVGVAGYTVFRNTVPIGTPSTNSFSDINLVPNTLYTYTVSASDGSGNNSAQSASAQATTFPDTTAPSIPTNLTAIPVGATQINLTWQASTDNVGVAGYRIVRNGTPLPTTTTTTSFSDTGLTTCTPYTYTVVAFDGAGNSSAPSAPASATPDVTPPSPPTGLTANVVSGNEIDLVWNAASDNCGGTLTYRVFRNGNLVSPSTGFNFTTFSDTGLTASTTYTYTVVAVDANGNASAPSASVVATTSDNVAPTLPSFLIATPFSASRIDLNWQPSTDNIGVTDYLVYRNNVNIGSTSATGFSDNVGLAACTTYAYVVVARDTAGNLSTNNFQTGPPLAQAITDVTAPSIPSNLTITAVGSTAVSLSWTGSTDNCGGSVSYRIYRNGILIATSPVTNFTDFGLNPGTLYNYSVSAVDQNNNESVRTPLTSVTTSSGQTLSFTSSPQNIGASVTTSSAERIVVTNSPQSVEAGEISRQVTFRIEDSNGFLVTTFNWPISVVLETPSNGMFFDTSIAGPFTSETLTLTPSGGVGTFYFKSTVAGTYQIHISSALPVPGTQIETIVSGPVSVSQSTVEANPAGLTVGGSSTMTVTLKDQNDNPIPGKTVTLSSSRGPDDTITQPVGFTDNNGTITGSVTSQTPGTAEISATADGITVNQTANVLFSP